MVARRCLTTTTTKHEKGSDIKVNSPTAMITNTKLETTSKMLTTNETLGVNECCSLIDNNLILRIGQIIIKPGTVYVKLQPKNVVSHSDI